MEELSESTALFGIRCPECHDWIPEPFAPFEAPYVVPFTHRSRARESCRLVVRVSSTGALARSAKDTSYEEALLTARRELGLGST